MTAFGWGFAGHRRLASLMHEPLPAQHCLRIWIASKQSSDLQNRSTEPDRWRDQQNPKYDPLEAPRHFLDIDELSPITGYPRDFAVAQMTLGAKAANDNGTVPWRVEAKYAELVEAFRQQNESAILETAFVMSHYVTDSFSILHTTKYFNYRTDIH